MVIGEGVEHVEFVIEDSGLYNYLGKGDTKEKHGGGNRVYFGSTEA